MRSLNLEGAPNFRDIGGIVTRDGGSVRPARFFRSGALSGLTDTDLEKVTALHIEYIYDLRSADERRLAPNRWPGREGPETILACDSDRLRAVRAFEWRARIADPTFDTVKARQWMLSTYASMPTLMANDIKRVADLILRPESPVTLIHCSAGKDRTGFIFAVLLLALNVFRDDVFEEYLRSRTRQSPSELLRALLGDELAALPLTTYAALLEMADVREEYLDSALRSIDREFGGLDTYLSMTCELDAARRNLLRAQLLDQ